MATRELEPTTDSTGRIRRITSDERVFQRHQLRDVFGRMTREPFQPAREGCNDRLHGAGIFLDEVRREIDHAARIRPAIDCIGACRRARVGNDLDQGDENLFSLIAAAVREAELEQSGAAVIRADRIVFENGTRVIALPSDFAGAAGMDREAMAMVGAGMDAATVAVGMADGAECKNPNYRR